jgi:hypothetical protein
VTQPKFVTGSDGSGVYESADFALTESRGVFGHTPGATKKYIRNDGPRDAEYRESMARMFVQMTAKEKELFLTSVPPETRPLAKVLAGTGPGASGGTGFIDFLLQQVNESFTEKYQVMETLSDNYVIYLFGQSAPMFSYSGTLLNTWQDDQRVWMTRLYRDVLRGTQLARRRKLLRLRYDSVIVSGVMLNLQMSIVADQEDRVPFSFNLIPTQYVIFTNAVGSPTQLKTPFTPSKGLALDTTKAPDISRLRVAGRAATNAQASKKRTIGDTKSQYSAAGGPKRTPKEKLKARSREAAAKKNNPYENTIRAGASVTTAAANQAVTAVVDPLALLE